MLNAKSPFVEETPALNLVEAQDGRWYFAGIGVPPILAIINADGSPASQIDADRVNALRSYKAALVSTRYFDDSAAGIEAARRIGRDVRLFPRDVEADPRVSICYLSPDATARI